MAKIGKDSRPTDAETAQRLHGTGGRLFVPAADGIHWRDTETGYVGALAMLANLWTADGCTQGIRQRNSRDRG